MTSPRRRALAHRGRRVGVVAIAAVMVTSVVVAAPAPAGAATVTGAGAWIVENRGQADVNSDVFFGSTCFVRDRLDSQRVGAPGPNRGPVTVGGCVFGPGGDLVDEQVTFEIVEGPGTFSWCPDPDGAGPKTATLGAAGRRCTQSGVSTPTMVAKVAVDSPTGGLTTVVVCADGNGDGCAGEAAAMTVSVAWTTSGTDGYVESLYQRMLGRSGDGDPGRAYFADQLATGAASRDAVARALLRSDEGVGQQVNLLFFDALDRAVDPTGRKFWKARLRATSLEQVRSELLATTEARSYTNGTPEGFVRRVYPRVLGRFADDGGVAFWADRIRAGESFEQVALQLHYSKEGREFAVVRRYYCCLHRAPTGGEVAYWAGRFGGAFDEAELEVQIEASGEHRSMFG